MPETTVCVLHMGPHRCFHKDTRIRTAGHLPSPLEGQSPDSKPGVHPAKPALTPRLETRSHLKQQVFVQAHSICATDPMSPKMLMLKPNLPRDGVLGGGDCGM